MNRVSEKSQRQCLKDIEKYHFLSFEEHSKFYLETISETIEKYDYIVLLCLYQNYITQKFDMYYYQNHRELEVLIGLISKYGRRIFSEKRQNSLILMR